VSDGDFDDILGDDLLFSDDVDDLPPFLSAPGVDGGDDDQPERIPGSTAAGNIPAGQFGRISYDRGDNEIIGVPTSLDGDHVPRARVSTVDERFAADKLRERAAVDTGNRYVGRVTGVNPAQSGTGAPRSYASIAEAGSAITESIERVEPTGDRTDENGGLDHRIANWLRAVATGRDPRLAGEQRNKLTANNRRTTSVAPTFKQTEFYCEFYGLKLNNAGNWLLTVKVENHEGPSMEELSRAVGLNLKTTMTSEGFV
jgi:hypothetical protein